jgi:eukaryotic-like serine/threonine-protein kinase
LWVASGVGHDQDSTDEPTAAMPAMTFRCPCGINAPVDANQLAKCPACGRITQLKELDKQLTVTLCSSHSSGFHPTPHESGDRSGETLGHFRLERRIGHGGMGAVYRALDTSLQRYVAVKLLRTGGGDSTTVHVRRLLDEAVAQARLSHPHVVTVYFVGREGSEPFLAMELLTGPTLEQRLRTSGPLPYVELTTYALQVIDALEQAARLSLVHGDIKPSNLLIAGPGLVKLGDFGLARTEQSPASEGISGTPSYLAPELIDGGVPSIQSDMFALGVTLFELAFGRRPYELTGQTLRDRLERHLTATVEYPERWPNGLPWEFRELLDRMLAKHPTRRFENYDQLRDALRRISPVQTTLAGRFSRAAAFAIDMAIQAALCGLLAVPRVIAAIQSELASQRSEVALADGWIDLIRIVGGFFTSVLFLVPLAMTWLEYRGWSTPGRYLFQLRVVDEHGLPPAPRVRVIRSVLRNALLWSSTILGVNAVLNSNILSRVDDVNDVIGVLLIVLSALLMLGPRRRTIHDLLCNTRVVLATDSRHG